MTTVHLLDRSVGWEIGGTAFPLAVGAMLTHQPGLLYPAYAVAPAPPIRCGVIGNPSAATGCADSPRYSACDHVPRATLPPSVTGSRIGIRKRLTVRTS